MDLRYIIDTAGGILTNTQVTWRTLSKNNESIVDVYRNYFLPILIIPVIGKFVGFSLVGYSLPYTNAVVHVPFKQGVNELLLTYFLVVIFVYFFAYILKKSIERLGFVISLNNSFKLAAFSSTPLCLSGMLFLFPGFSQLVIFGAAYAIYLFYQGVIEIVDESGNKAISIVVVAIGVILSFWISLELLLNSFVRSIPG
ncbi:MAG: YIP1 family protein [Deferribacteres bacterium]|nr:YIP1 family protein [candidate division KSB1 bacterium]MCB9501412.1 YIP1 family protein [Deferribacteres bacterium]